MFQALNVPYNSNLGVPLARGQTLTINGKFNDDAKIVEYNLLQGGFDIGGSVQAILHAKINFSDKKIILNTYTNGAWGKEERHSVSFKPGTPYELRFRVLDEGYSISADGVHLTDFAHRVPYEVTDRFQVKGDTTLDGVKWSGGIFQLPWQTGFQGGHLLEGQSIELYAIPKGDRFSVDLIARNQDLLFHFNPRFKEGVIVRNAHKNGFWEKEEREGTFPFHKNTGFTLKIVNESFSIQIFVNGERFGTFQHRTANPIGDYVGVRIDGEIEMTDINFGQA